MPHFAEAVTREDIVQTRKNNAEAWIGDFNIEQYLARDDMLANNHAANGLHFRTWKLEDEGKIVSACETLQRSAYRKAKGEAGKEVPEFVVASVFTPSVFRKRGYAGHLLTDVTKEHQKDGIVTLWSDVGNYYAKFGYKLGNCEQITAKISENQQHSEAPIDGVTLLDNHQVVTEILPKHIKQVKETVDNMVESDGKTRFAVIPHRGMYEQLAIRSDHHRDSLNQSPVTSYGGTTKNAWMAWAPFFSSKTVFITAMGGPANELALLFKACLREAAAYGIDVMVFKDTVVDIVAFEQALKDAGVKYELAEREGSWPMFVAPEECEWVCAGKYAWF